MRLARLRTAVAVTLPAATAHLERALDWFGRYRWRFFAALMTAAVLIVAVGRASATIVQSTAYCLTTRTAAGTYSVPGTVAMNGYAFGTRITARGPGGRTRWVVRDRPDEHTQLDFWIPSCWGALQWGAPMVNYRVGWPVKRGRVLRRVMRGLGS